MAYLWVEEVGGPSGVWYIFHRRGDGCRLRVQIHSATEMRLTSCVVPEHESPCNACNKIMTYNPSQAGIPTIALLPRTIVAYPVQNSVAILFMIFFFHFQFPNVIIWWGFLITCQVYFPSNLRLVTISYECFEIFTKGTNWVGKRWRHRSDFKRKLAEQESYSKWRHEMIKLLLRTLHNPIGWTHHHLQKQRVTSCNVYMDMHNVAKCYE